MKARFYSAKEKQMILKLAKVGAEAQLEQVGKRHDAVFAISMYNVGIPVDTINKAVEEMQSVWQGFSELKEDKLADYKLQSDLKRIGINIDFDFDEI